MMSLELLLSFCVLILGLTEAVEHSKDLTKCRQVCYQKFIQEWHHCMDFEDCKKCWNSCDQNLGPFPLQVDSATIDKNTRGLEVHISWDERITNTSKQCLVTWEVSGGGLMGNLLTDGSTVELSLWSDTIYHVQVTCKNKVTGGMRRSYKLNVDTAKLLTSSTISKTTSTSTSTTSASTSSSADLTASTARVSITTTTSSQSTLSSKTNQNHISEKISLLEDLTTSEEKISRGIIFAMLGSFVVFIGVIVIIVFNKPYKKKPQPVEKEELIENEVQPHRSLHV
ncbi:hypothetical protein ACFFRR_002920 [Megaselia abdita]